MRILIVSPSWIGDAVLAHPLLVRLRERHPGSVIDVLAPPWALPVFRRMPEVADTLALPFGHGELKLAGRRRFARTLPPYDRAVVLPNSWKSALIPWHAGIAVRTGYRGEMRYGLLNDVRALDKPALPLIVERYAALAEPKGAPLARPVPRPRLSARPEAVAATLAKLGIDPARPAVALAPGAEFGPAKRWPARHFAALAATYLDRGYQVWILGSAKDAEIADQVSLPPGSPLGQGSKTRGTGRGSVHNLAGRTTLDEAIDLLSFAERVVTNDSGLMHVAAALDRPMAAIFGSSSPAFTPPLSDNARIISLKLSCSPCFKRTCPLGHTNCLEQLEPARVLSELDTGTTAPGRRDAR